MLKILPKIRKKKSKEINAFKSIIQYGLIEIF